MSLRIDWSETALDELRRLDRKTAQRVVLAVERYATLGHGDVKKLKGIDAEWRLRVGSWRVRFTRNDAAQMLRILRVVPRGSAYKD